MIYGNEPQPDINKGQRGTLGPTQVSTVGRRWGVILSSLTKWAPVLCLNPWTHRELTTSQDRLFHCQRALDVTECLLTR